MAWKNYGNFNRKKNNKYNNLKTYRDGIAFDSKREAIRYTQLKLLLDAGEISDLERQVKFVLIPTQREPDIIGPRGGRKPGKLIEKECFYVADFVYIDNKTGEKVIEDTKGMRTPDYLIKRKLMLKVHGIRIREI